MPTNKGDNERVVDESIHFVNQGSSGGMTPSIINTINNTSSTPLSRDLGNNNIVSKDRRGTEPYESYIEDSFLGHWEREDDDDEVDPNRDYKFGQAGGNNNGTEEDETNFHPSTIEFDFDSFGPESFIYTPTAKQQKSSNDMTTNPVNEPQQQQQQTMINNSTTTTTVNPNNNTNNDQDKLNVVSHGKPADTNVITYDQMNQHGAIATSRIENMVGEHTQIDLKVIEPYKKVISHAGYCNHFDSTVQAAKPGEPAPAVIIFSACYLPDRSRRDYDYVMDHLFLYVLSSLHELIADDYILIYLHNTQPSSSTFSVSSKTSSSNNIANGSVVADEPHHQNNLPTFTWMKRCYQMIDRKLRKNLRILYLVKPTFWLKTIVIMCKPFISTKFSRKLRFIENMDALRKCLPVDELILPASAEHI